MKRLITALAAIWLLTLSVSAYAAYDPDVDYMGVMLEAATHGDYEAGQEAEARRNEKIDAMGLDLPYIAFEDLYLLAKIAQAEAGNVPGEAGDKTCQGIMEVVMNRVASPEFPDTVHDVVYQRGQYYIGLAAWKVRYFENTQPTARVLAIALLVLEGERTMTPDVVYHSNSPMGGGSAYSVYMGKGWGTMYFSYSDNRSLYE